MSDRAESDTVEQFEQGLEKISQAFGDVFRASSDEGTLRAAAAKFIGPSGELTTLLKMMPALPGDRRKGAGQKANHLKQRIQQAFDQQLREIAEEARRADLASPPLDPTLPGRGLGRGALHPITRTIYELLDAFESIGFEIVEAPQVELAEYNFSRLGFPPDHPATDMQDSFFLEQSPPAARFDEQLLLRTHTSNAQVHVLMARKEYPIRCVTAGPVYRRDDDATHSPMFHQIECLWVDRGITMAHLRGALTTFVQRMFGASVPVRFRPSYFPFTEPSAEVDIGCTLCRAYEEPGSDGQIARTNACRVCKATGWLEVLGSGMVHPVVLSACGHDPAAVSGFAFGLGVERIAMLRHDVSHIRALFDNDIRFLEQLR